MSARNRQEVLTVGARPRVDLMPPEIVAEHRAKRTRRRLLLGLLGVVLVVGLATVGATSLRIGSEIALASAQLRTTELLAEQAKYIEVRRVQEEIALVESGQKVGASTEIDWKEYLLGVQSKLPAGVVVMSVSMQSASPLEEFDQPDVPLQGPRTATVAFAAVSATIPDVRSWLDGLAELPGYVDATPDSVTLDEESGLYTAAITMQIDEGAWSERFTPDDEKINADEKNNGDENADDENADDENADDENADENAGDDAGETGDAGSDDAGNGNATEDDE